MPALEKERKGQARKPAPRGYLRELKMLRMYQNSNAMLANNVSDAATC
jgi:hypothetical protein